VSGFFEPPPPPPEPEPRHEQPVWIGPPRGTLPGVVALELLLARSEKAAVYISRLGGYPTGFEFDVVSLTAPGIDEELDPMMFGPHRHRRHGAAAPGELPPEMLRIGIEFSDGSRVTNVAGFPHRPDEAPAGPVMIAHGGGGGGGEWRQSQWVWPLPPAGRLSFVCEWPAVGIELTRAEIEGQLILDAAARAQTIFTRPPGSGGASSMVRRVAVTKPPPQSYAG
jgi:hypothetical protein